MLFKLPWICATYWSPVKSADKSHATLTEQVTLVKVNFLEERGIKKSVCVHMYVLVLAPHMP